MHIKSLLLHKIEGDTDPVEILKQDYALIIDGMAIVRQIKSTGLTFREYSTKLLQQVMSCGKFASRIDVVFDIYLENSIKDVERQRRSSENVTFHRK